MLEIFFGVLGNFWGEWKDPQGGSQRGSVLEG